MKTLRRPRSAQQAFNNVWRWFIIRGNPLSQRPATEAERMNGNNSMFCMYRSEDGTRGCAIGCQLPDKLYQSKYEGKSVAFMLEEDEAIKKHFEDVDWDVLNTLQRMHDNSFSIEELEEKLREYASYTFFTIPQN